MFLVDRRTLLRYALAVGLGSVGSLVSARNEQHDPESIEEVLENYEESQHEDIDETLERLLDGGSSERQGFMKKAENDGVLVRHLGNIHSLGSSTIPSEEKKVIWTLGALVEHTNPDVPRPYSFGEVMRGEVSLDDAVTLTSPHLGRFADLAGSALIDDRFLVAKIARESNGDLYANTGALGLTQVMPATYSDHVRWARESVASNRAVLPADLYAQFVEGERPLRDALLVTPDLAQRAGFELSKRTIGRSDAEYLDRWLPFGIVIEKHHAGRFPARGGVYETLLTADTSITSGGLIALSYLLRLNHTTKQLLLPEFAYDPAQVLARSLTPPDALAAAFNAGDGYAVGRLMDALIMSEPTVRSVREGYDAVDALTRGYRQKVLSSTGVLQGVTDSSVSRAR